MSLNEMPAPMTRSVTVRETHTVDGSARCGLSALYTLLDGWDLHVAAAEKLTPWRGEPLGGDRQQDWT